MSDFKEGVVVVIDGTAKWARLTEESGPNEMSQKFQLDLYLSPDSLKKLEEIMAQEIIKDKGEARTSPPRAPSCPESTPPTACPSLD
jgi:hypothetical protein